MSGLPGTFRGWRRYLPIPARCKALLKSNSGPVSRGRFAFIDLTTAPDVGMGFIRRVLYRCRFGFFSTARRDFLLAFAFFFITILS